METRKPTVKEITKKLADLIGLLKSDAVEPAPEPFNEWQFEDALSDLEWGLKQLEESQDCLHIPGNPDSAYETQAGK